MSATSTSVNFPPKVAAAAFDPKQTFSRWTDRFADLQVRAKMMWMRSRLVGLVGTLWLFFAIASVIVAAVFSPMGISLLMPDRHPASWLYPTLLLLPPLVLIGQHYVGEGTAKLMLWPITFALALCLFVLLYFFGGTLFAH